MTATRRAVTPCDYAPPRSPLVSQGPACTSASNVTILNMTHGVFISTGIAQLHNVQLTGQAEGVGDNGAAPKITQVGKRRAPPDDWVDSTVSPQLAAHNGLTHRTSWTIPLLLDAWRCSPPHPIRG